MDLPVMWCRNMNTAQVSKDVPPRKRTKLSSNEQTVSFYDPIANCHNQRRFVPSKQTDYMSKLPNVLLGEIAKRLKKLEDFTCFRSVSRSFHLYVGQEFFEGLPFRKSLPYLMLPPASGYGNDDIRRECFSLVEGESINDDIRREFFSLVEGESIVASLGFPKFRTTSKMYFESLGWLLTVEVDGSMSLLDPFSETEIPLPHLHTFNPEYEWVDWDKRFLINKMVLSSRPNETSDFIMMVIIGDYTTLAFWRLGNKAWNEIAYLQNCSDVVYGGGEQFYVICRIGTIWVINFAGVFVESRIIIDNEPVLSERRGYGLYILKAIDGSLLVIKSSRDDKYFLTSKFEVYEVDIETGTWKEIHSLGSMAVFIGRNSSIALDATASSNRGAIEANHIYFTDEYGEYFISEEHWRSYAEDSPDAVGGSVDCGVFNFETGDVESILVEPLESDVCPAMWITPNLCDVDHWKLESSITQQGYACCY